MTDGGERLLAVVWTSLRGRDRALSNLVVVPLIAAPLALLLVSGAGYAVAAAALRPVELMRRRAEEIEPEQAGRRLPVAPARDEVGRLGETLNAMLARLSRRSSASAPSPRTRATSCARRSRS